MEATKNTCANLALYKVAERVLSNVSTLYSLGNPDHLFWQSRRGETTVGAELTLAQKAGSTVVNTAFLRAETGDIGFVARAAMVPYLTTDTVEPAPHDDVVVDAILNAFETALAGVSRRRQTHPFIITPRHDLGTLPSGTKLTT